MDVVSQACTNPRVISVAPKLRAFDAFWPDHKGVKSLKPCASAAARKGATAAVASGNAGAAAFKGPNSRMRRLTMPRAGRPLNKVVKAVC